MGKRLKNCIADDKKWLRTQYVVLGKSITCIAKDIGVSRSAIEDRMLKFGIPKRKSWKEKHNELISMGNEIIKLYTVDDLTTQQIAVLLGFEKTAVRDFLRKNNVLKTAGEKLRGRYTNEKSSNWRGGKTKLGQIIRSCSENRKWIKKVLERDNYTCKICNKRGGDLHVDHIFKFSWIIDLLNIKTIDDARKYGNVLWDINNGRTLCVDCHRKTDTYGYSGVAPTLSTAANAVDIISFLYDGTNFYGTASLNFA